MSFPRIRLRFTCLAAAALAVCGCTLFQASKDMFAFWPETSGGKGSPLPPLVPARDSLQIDLVFVERPLGSPVLGDSLWKDIDELSAVSREERESLKRLGLRVGNAGASPCPALEQLLEVTTDPVDAANRSERMKPQDRKIYPRSGEESPIETNTVAHCTIDVPTLNGEKSRTYDNFASVLRMTPRRVQDGWARLEFVPEAHYGEKRLRPIPNGSTWEPREAQEVDSLLSQQFSIKLHVGEMAVISADPDRPRSFGYQSFVQDRSPKMQRVLIVRLSNMSRLDPIYAKSNAAK